MFRAKGLCLSLFEPWGALGFWGGEIIVERARLFSGLDPHRLIPMGSGGSSSSSSSCRIYRAEAKRGSASALGRDYRLSHNRVLLLVVLVLCCN